MSNAYIHAERSAKRWGGDPKDYRAIQVWFDQVKSHVADNRHRAVLHNAWGIHLAIEVFGTLSSTAPATACSSRRSVSNTSLRILDSSPL
jgi:hypothetical protein